MNSSAETFHSKKALYLIGLIASLILLVVGKDLLHASIRNYSFYIEESLLFATFWVLFVPLIILNKRITVVNSLLVKTLASSFIHITFFALIVHVISTGFYSDPFDFTPVFINSISEDGLICILVYAVVGYRLFQKHQTHEKAESKRRETTLLVRVQSETITVDLKNIVYIQAEKPYIALNTEEKKYLHNYSLKRFLTEYSEGEFIQIHKSTIINKEHVVSFKSRKNGDYDVQLTNNDEVRASRSYRHNFEVFLKRHNLE